MNDWIKCTEQKPPAYKDILVTDGERCWIAQTFDNLDVYLMSHPDYQKVPENKYGCPFITFSKPTHWRELPEFVND